MAFDLDAYLARIARGRGPSGPRSTIDDIASLMRAHMAAIGREGGESRGAKNRRRQTAASRGSESSGGAYSDRESPVEVSREGMLGSQSSRSTRDELSDNGMESVRDEDVPNPT